MGDDGDGRDTGNERELSGGVSTGQESGAAIVPRGPASGETARAWWSQLLDDKGLVSMPYGNVYPVTSIVAKYPNKVIAQARGSNTPATADLRIRVGLAQALMIEGRSFRYDYFGDAPIMPGTAQVLKEKGELDTALGLIKPARVQHIDFGKPFMIAERALENAGRIDDPSLPPIDRCVPYLHAHTVIQASNELLSKVPENEHQEALINRAMATVNGREVLAGKVKALEEKSAGLRDAVVSLLRLTDADLGLTLHAARSDKKLERFGIRLAEGWLVFSTKSLIGILTTNPATVESGAADAAFRGVDGQLREKALGVLVRAEDVNLARHLLAIAARCKDPYLATEVVSRLVSFHSSAEHWLRGPHDWLGVDWSLLAQPLFVEILSYAWDSLGTHAGLGDAFATDAYVKKILGKQSADRHPLLAEIANELSSKQKRKA